MMHNVKTTALIYPEKARKYEVVENALSVFY